MSDVKCGRILMEAANRDIEALPKLGMISPGQLTVFRRLGRKILRPFINQIFAIPE